MKIRVLTVNKNERVIMPFFIKHYEPWVDEIIIADGYSTDDSIDTAIKLGNGKVRIVHCDYDDGQYINDDILKKIRNNEWKENAKDFDWVIVCDADELLYSKNIINHLQKLKQEGITLPNVLGYDMISLKLPNENLPITEQIKTGIHWPYCNKNIIFNPKEITDINYTVGSHSCFPTGNVIRGDVLNMSLYLLHYRRLSYEYHKNKAAVAANRMSEINKNNGWGTHNKQTADTLSEHEYICNYIEAKLVI